MTDPEAWQNMTPTEREREFARRRSSRARATAFVLAGLVLLIFALAIAKIRAGWTP
jgi:hypothetical protein